MKIRGEELKELDSETTEKLALSVLKKAKQCVTLGYDDDFRYSLLIFD